MTDFRGTVTSGNLLMLTVCPALSPVLPSLLLRPSQVSSQSHLSMPHSLWPLDLDLCCSLHFHGPSHQAISTSWSHEDPKSVSSPNFHPIVPKLSPPVHFCVGTSIPLVPF